MMDSSTRQDHRYHHKCPKPWWRTLNHYMRSARSSYNICGGGHSSGNINERPHAVLVDPRQ